MIPKLQMLCYKDRLKRVGYVIHKTIQKRPTSSFRDIASDLKVWMKYVRRLNKDEGINFLYGSIYAFVQQAVNGLNALLPMACVDATSIDISKMSSLH